MNPITGRGGLPLVRLETPWSAAEIYLQGACLTHFQLHGEPPLLFLSEKSRFEKDAPIRGGIPIVFPWFGKPEGRTSQHGFARVRSWELVDTSKHPDGSVTAHFTFPICAELLSIPVDYYVTVGKTLTAELVVTNFSAQEFTFENCLHTYFTIGDIHQIAVTGLQGRNYLDSLAGRARRQEMADAIRFTSEVDRIYVDTAGPVEIHDPVLRRVIRVETTGANSTVVWNPWIAKAKAMADFGDAEYQRMVCVESGNIAANEIKLAVGQEARLKVNLSSSTV